MEFICIVYNVIGFMDPLTVTLSISLHLLYTEFENFENKLSLINSYTPYYFVADSNLAAIFTY